MWSIQGLNRLGWWGIAPIMYASGSCLGDHLHNAGGMVLAVAVIWFFSGMAFGFNWGKVNERHCRAKDQVLYETHLFAQQELIRQLSGEPTIRELWSDRG